MGVLAALQAYVLEDPRLPAALGEAGFADDWTNAPAAAARQHVRPGAEVGRRASPLSVEAGGSSGNP
jgi:hypothetical protein